MVVNAQGHRMKQRPVSPPERGCSGRCEAGEPEENPMAAPPGGVGGGPVACPVEQVGLALRCHSEL